MNKRTSNFQSNTINNQPLNYFTIFNVQGLKPKTVPSTIPFISDLLHFDNQLFIGLTETWLNNHTDAELSIPNYKLFRSDRLREKRSKRGRDSGGVALYIRSDLAHTTEVLLTHSNGVIEILVVLCKNENLLLGVVYRQPDDSTHGHPSAAKEFKESLNALSVSLSEKDLDNYTIIIGGDFNLPHVTWPHGIPTQQCTKEERAMLKDLTHFTDEMSLTQEVTLPTHKDGNVLDLILTNNQYITHEIIIETPLLSISHHKILKTTTKLNPTALNCNKKPKNTTKKNSQSRFDILNFQSNDVDWDRINNDLNNHNWETMFSERSIDENLESFYSTCYKICLKYTPFRKDASTSKVNHISKLRYNLLRRRKRINKYLRIKLPPSRTLKLNRELIEIEKSLQLSYKNSAAFREEKAITAIKSNPKFFYSYAKKHSKLNTEIGPLINNKGVYTNDSKEMADLLSDQFSSVFSTPLTTESIIPLPQKPTQTINDIKFDHNDIASAIGELSSNSASGPDGYPAILLKNCVTALSRPLQIFWRKSLDEHHIPLSLKSSIITPKHKGDSHALPANYRPIALTSHLIKIFEKIIRKKITIFFDQNNLFNSNQHGFRAGRSCLSQLILHYDTILTHMEQGTNVDVVYLDFAKAFDKVDFNVVLNKINSLGIKGKISNWIEEFLTNRVQSVTINGIQSSPKPVTSGVPQGSVSGTTIFLILISDIDNDVKHSVL